MKIVNHYRQNEILRRSFNRLAEQTFGIYFEDWYQNGFWKDNYDPYSVVIDGEVVANVSLNRTDMVIGGQRKRLYQLGTVMTAPEHRGKGYIRSIMAEIEKDTADADGVYLFANDSVLDFYSKFAFTRGTEYLYNKAVSQNTKITAVPVSMDGPDAWMQLALAMEETDILSDCQAVGNPGLVFFYVSQFMQNDVYYLENLTAWVIAEVENGVLFLHNVFAPSPIDLDSVIAAFGSGIMQVTLGFTPKDKSGWQFRELLEEDSTFFVKGPAFSCFTEKKLRIPRLSHA